MSRATILLLGVATVIGATWLWHGPLGAATACVGSREAGSGACSTRTR